MRIQKNENYIVQLCDARDSISSLPRNMSGLDFCMVWSRRRLLQECTLVLRLPLKERERTTQFLLCFQKTCQTLGLLLNTNQTSLANPIGGEKDTLLLSTTT